MPDDLIIPGQSLSSVVPEAYKDLLQPSIKRVGYSLETLVKVALTPFDIIDWGFEKSKDWLTSKINERLAQLPPENVVEPRVAIASVALSRIATSCDTPELRNLYAELLLKAMDSNTVSEVHPAYFYIIDQLEPKEALVLVGLYELKQTTLFKETVTHAYTGSTNPSIERQFESFCESVLGETGAPDVWLTNLCRLGVLSLELFSEATFHPEIDDDYGVSSARVVNHDHRILSFTSFGESFIDACAPLP